jgi:hypothetical protein
MKRQLLCGVLAAAIVVMVAAMCAIASDAPVKAEKAAPPPKPLILKFKHIPAESFVASLKQLGHGNKLGEGLEKLPLALNEPSNSIIVLAPPEVADFLTTIAVGLDKPNEFRDERRAEEQKAAEQRLKIEEARQKAGLPPVSAAPMARMREGVPPQAPRDGMMPGRMGGGMMQQRMGGMMQRQMQGAPRGPMAGMMGRGQGRGPGMMGRGQGRGPMMGQGQGRGPGMMGQGQGRGPMMGQGQGRGPGMMGEGQGQGSMMEQRQGRGPMMGQGEGRGPMMGEGRGPMMGRGEGEGPMMRRGGQPPQAPPAPSADKNKPPAPPAPPADKGKPPAPPAS